MQLPATTAPTVTALPVFDDFYRDQFASVANTAALMARDPDRGPDLAQEAFARAFERWDTFSSHEHARNFVFRVTANLARSHVRWTRVRSSTVHGERVGDDPDPAGAATEWIVVAAALTQLPPRQRACVVLHDFADLDTAAIGRVLGISESTVRVHLGRGRKTLRTMLALREEIDR